MFGGNFGGNLLELENLSHSLCITYVATSNPLWTPLETQAAVDVTAPRMVKAKTPLGDAKFYSASPLSANCLKAKQVTAVPNPWPSKDSPCGNSAC